MSDALRYKDEYIGQACVVNYERGFCLSFENWEGLEKFLQIPNEEHITWGGEEIKMSDFKKKFYSRGDAIYICSEHELKARGFPPEIRKVVNKMNHPLASLSDRISESQVVVFDKND